MSELFAEEKTENTVDESIYAPPYAVKDGCLYEMVQIKDQTVPIKLADFVPVLVAEITCDDGTEQTKMFKVSALHRSGIALPEVTVSADEM